MLRHATAARLGIIPAAAIWLLALHMVLLASAPPVERHLRVHAASWPSGASGMRIVLLSDLHVSIPGDSPDHLARIVDRVNATHPDLVLIAGDFLSTDTTGVWSAPIGPATAPLGALRARLGTVAVLGNHDYEQPAQLEAALASRGVAVLENSAIRRGPVTILGLGDMHTGHARFGLMTRRYRALGGWPIILSHSPDVVPRLSRSLPLAFAGHMHCGQVHLPFLVVAKEVSQYGNRYRCGLVPEPGRLTLVTGGLGVSQLPLRFDAPPDYWVIDLGR